MGYQQFIFDSSASADANSPTFNMFRAPYISKFKLLTAQVPTTFHSTGRQNNIVAIRENGTVRYVTLPYGDYSAASFPGMLAARLGSGYTVSYDESQRNIKIENGAVDFSILGLDGGTTAYSQLGWRRQGESPTARAFQGGVSDFSGTSSLLLVCSELITQDVMYAANPSLNVIALVELHSPQGSYVYWENPGNWLTMNSHISYCKFRFLDSKTLNEIDFRGAPFTIQLAVLTGEDDEYIY
jgi:hypothetical protein